MAKYKALLLGLKLTKILGAIRVSVLGDSYLFFFNTIGYFVL